MVNGRTELNFSKAVISLLGGTDKRCCTLMCGCDGVAVDPLFIFIIKATLWLMQHEREFSNEYGEDTLICSQINAFTHDWIHPYSPSIRMGIYSI